MFCCPLCEEEYIFVSSLCPQCTKIKDIIKLYGKDRILERLQTTYIVQRPKSKNDESTENKK
tara:strand:- start:645 stop:830 length:186 start_codon:yes stop_codon:yes gene_type:complete